jgi:hypothetical protein
VNRVLANHRLEPANAKQWLGKRPLLGKAYNNTDSDMFSIGPTQGYVRRYSIRNRRERYSVCMTIITSSSTVVISLQPATFNSSSSSVYSVQL